MGGGGLILASHLHDGWGHRGLVNVVRWVAPRRFGPGRFEELPSGDGDLTFSAWGGRDGQPTIRNAELNRCVQVMDASFEDNGLWCTSTSTSGGGGGGGSCGS